MPDIRYICLSDLHLGKERSVLTKMKAGSSEVDPMQPNPVLIQMTECLRHLISKNENQNEKPILVPNGDVWELALANINEAAMVFERLIELFMPAGEELFDKQMIMLPGNHDHLYLVIPISHSKGRCPLLNARRKSRYIIPADG